LLCCLAWYGRQTVWHVLPTLDAGLSDFQHYYRAAQQILAGRSPFTTYGYVYPPLLADLLTPLASLDYVTARCIWFVFSQFCLLTAAWIMWRALGRDWTAACCVAFVWAGGEAAWESLLLGQIGPQLTLLLALAYTQRGWRQGMALGVGAAIKLLPGVAGLAILLAAAGRPKALRGTMLAAGVSAVLLIAVPWLFVFRLDGPKFPAKGEFFSGTPAILSWSLPSAVLRALDSPRSGGPLPRNWYVGNNLMELQLPPWQREISMSVAIVTFAVGIIVLAIATRGRLDPAWLPFAMAASLSLGLAAAPLSWGHYQVMQYPAVALLLCHVVRLHLWRRVLATVVCGAFLYPLPVAVLTAYYRHRGNSWEPASPVTLHFWMSVTPVASLVLFWLLIAEVRRMRP
jgi:hypothetical protein